MMRRRWPRRAAGGGLALSLLLMVGAIGNAQSTRKHRPVIGVAFGGGSALGLAHVGVIRWFEDHHVPIDVVAGTSMGGLVGGAYATGMSSSDLAKLLARTDWEEMFGSVPYRYLSVRRKQDTRAYPSHLTFGLRRGVALPSALNNGQQVDLFLARLGAAYAGLGSFDSLPTPFRCVAFDIRTAERIVLDGGSLPLALRSTMSLPGIFPPVETDGRLLVDGGAVDNVPADVARAMGADVVIAVNVGKLPDSSEVKESLYGLVNGTVDAMMRASTRRGLAAADVIINPVLEQYGRFDWELAPEMAQEGYRAAEAESERLLGLAVSDDEWRQYLAGRRARRRAIMPRVASIEVVGATPGDMRTIRRRLQFTVGRPLDIDRLDDELVRLSGLDRYESVAWDLEQRASGVALVVVAHPRPNAPPLGMFAVNIENITSDDYTFQLAARYLAFDVLAPRSELRADIALGSNPHVGAELRRAFGSSSFFGALSAGAARLRRNFSRDNTIVAQYDQHEVLGGADLGVLLGSFSELRAGLAADYLRLRRRVGDPGLPSLRGTETQALARWIYDSQIHYITPAAGLRLLGRGRYVFSAPSVERSDGVAVSNRDLGQLELLGSQFWAPRGGRDRVFVTGAGGTTVSGHPLLTDQFSLGLPMQLDAFSPGERVGNHYVVLTPGYLYSIGKLPAFFGGNAFAGAWVESGSVFDNGDSVHVYTQLGVGAIVETLVGPALIGATIGAHGQHRVHVAFGAVFP